MAKSLRERTISGMIWSSVHRFGTMIISFIANIVLARLLTPEDFGIIGMIMVFVAISSTLVDGGFASALIQKKRPTKEDYSTVFYWNLILSLVLFLLIYFSAPLIEQFYEMPTLSPVLRVLGFVLILNAFNIIQFNQLNKQLNFKRVANVNLLAFSFSAVIGISMAYNGFGVWSLVAKMLAVSFFQSLILWILNDWRPSLIFSFRSLKELFGFGSYMLLTSLLVTGYNNIKALIIGKVFSASDLGFFIQAERMKSVPVQGLSAVVNQVTFPVFSELQDDKERLLKGLKKSIRAITFVNFPVMALVVVISQPLIIVLLTEKWIESAIYLQILCVGGMVYTLSTVNNNVFKSLGESKLYFFVLLFKRVNGIILIIIGLRYGLIGMIIGVVLNNYISFVISMYYSSKLCGYTVLDQISDVIPSYLISIVTAIIVYFAAYSLFESNYSLILFSTITYLLIYTFMSYIFNNKSLSIFTKIIMEKK